MVQKTILTTCVASKYINLWQSYVNSIQHGDTTTKWHCHRIKCWFFFCVGALWLKASLCIENDVWAILSNHLHITRNTPANMAGKTTNVVMNAVWKALVSFAVGKTTFMEFALLDWNVLTAIDAEDAPLKR